MQKGFDHKKIEKKWSKNWLGNGIYEPDFKKTKKPFYNLMMFPYPSAEGLHVGNMYAFTGADIYGRFKRMSGYDVLEPIGLDGFGIHSENYALKIGAHPMKQAKVSQKRFYLQLQKIGNGFAWKEKLETYDPKYYRWTQWLFVQMFKKGLAYRKKQNVNWCPSCKTVLADEQVIGGKCERCGTEAIKKALEQWFFKITDYAERLLANLKKMDWSEKVKIAQKEWIGKSEGSLIKFQILKTKSQIEVFTTRPDTLFGATYMVLAPEHEIIKNLESSIKNLGDVNDYIKKTRNKSEEDRIAEGKEKTGVELKGIKAVNPANKKEIPVFIADYVLSGYGTGAIMAVPAHDERDWEFAKKYKLPIEQVIEPLFTQTWEPGAVKENLPFIEREAITAIVKHWKEDKYIGLKWKKVNWGTFITGGVEKGQTPEEAAIAEIKEETGYIHPKLFKNLGRDHSKFYHVPKQENRFAHFHVLYFELKDGAREAISEEESSKHEVVWLSRNELSKFLTPEGHNYNFSELQNGKSMYQGEGILTNSGKFSGMDSEKAKWEITKFVGGKKKIQYHLRDWLISRQRYWGPPIPMIHCEACAKNGKGEKRDMPGWYAVPEKDLPIKLPFVKNFRPQGEGHSPLASVRSFHETKCPGCGVKAHRETDVSDTFLDSSWYFLRYPSVADKKNAWDQAMTKKWLPVNMYIGGAEHAVLHLLYSRFMTMVAKDWGLLDFEEPFSVFRAHGLLIKEGGKMSKSKGNVVNPDEYIEKFGADTLRMYLMFLAPFEQGGDFRDQAVMGVRRFLDRVWNIGQGLSLKKIKTKEQLEVSRALNKAIKKVTEDIENLHYNTSISSLMILLNEMEKYPAGISITAFEVFLKLLAPFAPFITEELWSKSGHKKSIHLEKWPQYDSELIKEENFELVIQVNGKVRDRVTVPATISRAEVEEIALASEKIKALGIKKDKIKNMIFITGKLINLVI